MKVLLEKNMKEMKKRTTENEALDNSTDPRAWVSYEEMQDAFNSNAETVQAIRGGNKDKRFTDRQIYDILVNMGKV